MAVDSPDEWPDPTDPSDPAFWDERYAEAVWSGDPNMALVRELEGATPGTVLDVGCGEGGDAIWLAQQGWQVTALDVSAVGIARAQNAAREGGVDAEWLVTGLLGLDPSRTFDLVSAFYPVLERTDANDAEHALLRAVAPGGTLLVVHHVMDGPDHDHGDGHGHGRDHGHDHDHGPGQGGEDGHEAAESGKPNFDHRRLVMPEQVHALLAEPEFAAEWTIELFERRPRRVASGHAASHHVEDEILRARRMPTA